MDLHLYFDNDDAGDISMRQSEFFINNNIQFFRGSSVYFHRNESGEKDYGVPLSKIKDSIRQILWCGWGYTSSAHFIFFLKHLNNKGGNIWENS